LLQALEVAADGHLGDTQVVAEQRHTDGAPLLEELDDARAAFGRDHLTDFRRSL